MTERQGSIVRQGWTALRSRVSLRRAWERGSVELGVAGVAAALVVGAAVGNGVARTAVDMFDGLTWLADDSTGQVVQVNPVTGRAELRLDVAGDGSQLGIAQRDGWLIIDDAATGDVVSIDLATLIQSGKRSGPADGQTKVLVAAGQAFIADLEKGSVSAVDPLTLKDLGERYRGSGPFADVVVDEAGYVWVLDKDAELVRLRYSPTAQRFVLESSRPVAHAGSQSRLVPHDEGVTVFAPEGPVVGQFGTEREFALPLFDVSGGVLAAPGAPVEMSPGSFTDSSTVAMVSGDDVLEVNVSAMGCADPGAPVVFSGKVYVPCLNAGKVVVLGADGMRAGEDIFTPDGGDPDLAVDDGRLLVSTAGGEELVVVEPDGSTRVIDIGGEGVEVFDPEAPPKDVTIPDVPPSLRPPANNGSGGPPPGNPGQDNPGRDNRDNREERDRSNGNGGDRDRDGDQNGGPERPGGPGNPGGPGDGDGDRDRDRDRGNDDTGNDIGTDDGGSDTGSDDGTDSGDEPGNDDGADGGTDDGTDEPETDAPQPASNVRIGETAGAYVVTWDHPERRPESYRVEPELWGAGSNETVSGDTTSVVVTDLRPGTSIRYRVISVGADGQRTSSAWSAPFDVPGVPPDPVAPLDVTALSTTPGGVDLSWRHGDLDILPDEYRVTQISGGSITPVVLNGSRQSTEITGLTEGASVAFRVEAVLNGETAGSDSSLVTVMETPPDPPEAPTGVQAQQVGTQELVRVTWNAPSVQQESLMVRRVGTGSGTSVNPAATSVELSQTFGTTARYEVVATRNGVEAVSDPSAQVTVSPPAPDRPSTPRNVSGSFRDRPDANTVRVDVSWQAPLSNGGAAIDRYRISGGGSNETATGTSATLTISCGGQALCTSGGTVNLSVVAVNTAGDSPAETGSAEVPAPPPPDPDPPSAPQSVSVSNVQRPDPNTVRMTVSWQPPPSDGGAAISGYSISGSGGGASGTASAGGGATSTTLDINCSGAALCSNSGTVTVSVTATNAAATGPAGTANASVPAPPPPPPANGDSVISSGYGQTTRSQDDQSGTTSYSVTLSPPSSWAAHGGTCELRWSGTLSGTQAIDCGAARSYYLGSVSYPTAGDVTVFVRALSSGTTVADSAAVTLSAGEPPDCYWPGPYPADPANTWCPIPPPHNLRNTSVESAEPQAGGGLASMQSLIGLGGLGLAGALRAVRLRGRTGTHENTGTGDGTGTDTDMTMENQR
ncbi:hypothetical protein G1H11_22320 [Phytoactinopolyspora alkaliphila]|uniref:Fibronectin type-III domain-containing protein n=1 Tax=Phytoactinopolyspora alkaliphila TaxID=1783498 RepID=A0A6N9YT76_9ACTN|nr:fibronectin type III domain-containing protein [Phytoactinopolyspora alkaliphila]NED98038.1 hypothetical protein [Phytoactinopolyspora alkaliphila]